MKFTLKSKDLKEAIMNPMFNRRDPTRISFMTSPRKDS